MALNYDDANTLMNDNQFKGRVKVACLHFAQYIIGEDPATAAHNTRRKWAEQTYLTPQNSAETVTPGVVQESHVQADGKNVSDVDLQTDVETVVNKMI